MSVEENTAVVSRYVEQVLNQQNIAALDTLLAPAFVHGVEGRGISGQAAALQSRFTAFPDAHVTLEHMMADGEQVAVRATWHGTHRQEWLGVPASNHEVTWGIMSFFRVEHGKIAHIWAIEDAAALQRQLREARARVESGNGHTHANSNGNGKSASQSRPTAAGN